MFGAVAVVAATLGGILGAGVAVGPYEIPAAQAATGDEEPVIFNFIAVNDRIDTNVDELRSSFVLKIPRGYINPVTGQLLTVDNKTLRLGYDFAGQLGNPIELNYMNTLNGAAGATNWAYNRDQYYTVHKVLPIGKYDYLVISVEGDMNVDDNPPLVPGGNPESMTWFFDFVPTGMGNGWLFDAATPTYEVPYWNYSSVRGATNVQGPIVQVQYDDRHSLWSGNQANWAAVLDYGLNGRQPGVLPPNSVAVELVNYAFNNVNTGPAASVTDSFWYAWVNEDGTLVQSLNTAPIRVTGITPSAGSYNSSLAKNTTPATSSTPTLAWTEAAAAQGLTANVGTDGAIDFTDAGGTGYYRLVVWPESHDPVTVTNQAQSPKSPLRSYTAADLFTADGKMTAQAQKDAWTAGSAVYKYSIDTPEAPVIVVPADGSATNQNTSVTISGTGTPGHSITLKLAPGTSISDVNSAQLTTLVDGDRACDSADDCVIVDEDGAWTFTYQPTAPLSDGMYTVVATQTEQSTAYHLTSEPSNPDNPAAPANWGVTFEVDTVVPAGVHMVCAASPTDDTTPTYTGSGVEPGATVRIYQDDEYIGDAIVDGTTWSYTPQEDLPAGTYHFSASQVDAAGNESERPDGCLLRIALDVSVQASKIVAPVQNGPAGLIPPDASNWDVTATADDEVLVLSGPAPVSLKRDVTYTVGERLHTGEMTPPEAGAYTMKGMPSCVDGEGDLLPGDIFDSTSGQLRIDMNDDVIEPIECTIVNQASVIAFVTKQVGGQTLAPASGWSLTASSSATGADVTLDAATGVREARPDDYALSVNVPAGFSVLAIEKLDVSDGDCAAAANDPATAAESCWVEIGGAQPTDAVVQGQLNVYRAVAASAQSLPTLPITGGMGSWIFTTLGLGALALSLLALVFRRRMLRA